MAIIVSAANLLQKARAFTWDESCELLEWLEYVEKAINDRKSAKCLREELKAEKKRLSAARAQTD